MERLTKEGVVECHRLCVATATNTLLVFVSIFHFIFLCAGNWSMMMSLYLLEENERDEGKWSVWLKKKRSALSLQEAMNLKWAVRENFLLNVGWNLKDWAGLPKLSCLYPGNRLTYHLDVVEELETVLGSRSSLQQNFNWLQFEDHFLWGTERKNKDCQQSYRRILQDGVSSSHLTSVYLQSQCRQTFKVTQIHVAEGKTKLAPLTSATSGICSSPSSEDKLDLQRFGRPPWSHVCTQSVLSLVKHHMWFCYNPTCWLTSVKTTQASTSSWII